MIGRGELEYAVRRALALEGWPQPDSIEMRPSKHGDWTLYLMAWRRDGRSYWFPPSAPEIGGPAELRLTVEAIANA